MRGRYAPKCPAARGIPRKGALAGFFGHACMSLLSSSTGSYQAAFALAMILAAAGLALTFVFARQKTRTHRAPEEATRENAN
ncbi:hypothetical protein [Hugonella massiliensis]|uniref:hypothetical protein n=1 Tax=Hugonella massiliensis TaxID=1720315 RepID=UPI00143163C6|nr:hypothetical protein [Hugonella massiliensis]